MSGLWADEGGNNSACEEESFCAGKCVLCGEWARELWKVNVNRNLRDIFNGVGGDKDSLGGGSDKLQLCKSCHSIMKSAVGKRKQATKTERRVRSLQLEILKELRQLQGEMGRFYEEMAKLERIVMGSLDKKNGSLSGLQFRRKIVKAVSDLRLYRYDIAVNLECDNFLPSTNEADVELLPPPAHCKVEPEEDLNLEDDHEYPVSPLEEEDDRGSPDFSTGEPSSPNDNPRPLLNNYQKIFRNVRNNSKVYQESEKLTESMPEFERRLVLHVIRKSEIRKALEKEGVPSKRKKVEGPEFEYDLEKEIIVLENVEVNINDPLKSLHCSICSYFRKLPGENLSNFSKWKGLPEMRLHILAAHLNNFKCTVCGKVMATKQSLRVHQKFQHPGESIGGSEVNCEICGKPFLSKKQVEVHKWRHLNDQEKEDAIAKGLGPPISTSQPRNCSDGVQCSKCGKTFQSKSSLKKHELNYCLKPRRKRGPPIIKMEGTETPPRKNSTALAHSAAICSECGKVFKNQKSLQTHEAKFHRLE